MSDKQINTYTKGFTPDIDPRRIGPDQMSDAQDIEFMSDGAGSSLSIEPLRSMEEAYSIPTADPQPITVRFNYIDYTTVTLKDTNGTVVASVYIEDSISFVDTLNIFLAPYGITAEEYGGVDGGYIAVYFQQSLTPQNKSWIIEQDGVVSPVLQIAIPYTTTFLQFGSLYLDDKLFVFSYRNSISEIGVVEDVGSFYQYTRLMRSNDILFPSNKVIDVRGESIADNKWGLYFTYGSKPRVLYVSKNIAEDSVYKYTKDNFNTGNPDGYIIGGYEEQQTSLQLFAPELRVEYSDQIQSGGSLVSGGYFYAVRAGVKGTENTTPWSFVTPNAIPVYVETFNSRSNFINIQGDRSGTITTKINQLLVSGIPTYIYDYIELACIYDAGGAKTAYIVDKFKVTSNSIIVNHTGNEISSSLDTKDLPEYVSVIKTAESLEIKRNRLNLADISVEFDEDLTAGFAGLIMQQGKENIGNVGTINTLTPRVSAGASNITSQLFTLNVFEDEAGELQPYVWPSGQNATRFVSAYPDPSLFRFTFDIDVQDIYPQDTLSFVCLKNSLITVNQTSLKTGGATTNIVFDVELSFGETLDFAFSETSPSNNVNVSTLSMSGYLYSTASFNGSKPGEYQDPFNCAKKVGYTLSERYPFYARVHYKSGHISSPYLLGTDAFLFDSLIGGIHDEYLFTDYNTSNLEVYSRYLQVYGLDFLSSNQDVLGVSIWRGECNPTILGTGIVMAADNYINGSFNTGEYPSIPQSNGKYGDDVPNDNSKRRFGMFVSPDIRKNKTQPNDGDIIIDFGNPGVMNNKSGIQVGPFIGAYAEYNGATSVGDSVNLDIQDAVYQPFNTKGATMLSDDSGLYYYPNTAILQNCNGSQEGIAFSLTNPDNPGDTTQNTLTGFGFGADNGIYIAQYYRPIANQYNLKNINVFYTGTYIPRSQFGSAASVFGGDTYTQKNILKVRYWSYYGTSERTRSSFITYYGQSKFNTQLGYNDYTVPSTMNLYGQKSITKYLFPYADQTQVAEDQFNFDAGFSAYNNVNVLRPYDKDIADNSDQPTTIYYSPQKPFTSIQDFYRTLNPFDTAELDPKNGRIIGLLDVQDYMMVLQPRAVTILPYSSDAFVNTTAGNVQTSSGSVYPNARRIVTTYGPSTKSAIINAQNRNGNAQPYWYSDKYYKLCRYGSDGVSLLSDVHGFRSYFLNNFTANSYEFKNLMGYHPRKQQLYVTDESKILGWNEVYNMSTGKYTFGIGLTRFFTFRDKLFAIYGSTAYSVATGSDWLQWPGGGIGQFIAESVFNKNAIADKRALSAAFAVGNSWNSPGTEVTFSSDTNTSTSTGNDLVYRRSSLITHAKRGINGQEAIIGQYIKVKIKAVNYIRLAATTITALVKGRRP